MMAHALHLLLFACLGMLMGATYLAALAFNVRLYCEGRPITLGVSIHILRLLGTALGFGLIALAGAIPLLLSLLGFQLINPLLLGRAKLWARFA